MTTRAWIFPNVASSDPLLLNNLLVQCIMLAIARKLAESDYLNKKLRQNIYIHGVECSCESGDKTKDSMEGAKCFCAVDVDLLGSRKMIRTNIDQPTDVVKIKIDPDNFMSLADTKSLFKSDTS